MTGWRLGYACGPEVIIKQMLKIHQFAIMCAPTTSQYAAVEALRNGDEDVAKMREEYNGRRRYLMHRFQEMGLSCFGTVWGVLCFPCIKEFGMTSEEFATKLLNSQKVAVVPGTCVMSISRSISSKSANADQLAFSTAIADLSLFCQLVFKFDLPIFLCRNSKKYHLTV